MIKPALMILCLVAALSIPAGCQATVVSETPRFSIDPALTGPVVVIPPGIESTQTAEQVTRRMLDLIQANERELGRVLAPARIIRVQLLAQGETYPTPKFDGTNPDGAALGTTDGPGWLVEATGTFTAYDRLTKELRLLSIHQYHLWEDAGGEGWVSIPCWSRLPPPLDGFDGVC